MSSMVPKELKYTQTHEWVREESNGTLTVGITDHAQQLLGDMVYVELPDVDKTLKATVEAGVVESVKAASDIYSPVSGKITEVNQTVVANPSIVNSDPYGEGWLFKIEPEQKQDINQLLDANAYSTQIADEE